MVGEASSLCFFGGHENSKAAVVLETPVLVFIFLGAGLLD